MRNLNNLNNKYKDIYNQSFYDGVFSLFDSDAINEQESKYANLADEKKDYENIRSDFKMVGKTIKKSINLLFNEV